MTRDEQTRLIVRENGGAVQFSVARFARIAGIGRSTAYEMIHARQVKTIKIGRRIKVPVTAIVDFLEAAEAEER